MRFFKFRKLQKKLLKTPAVDNFTVGDIELLAQALRIRGSEHQGYSPLEASLVTQPF